MAFVWSAKDCTRQGKTGTVDRLSTLGNEEDWVQHSERVE
jgi:hypothetical protein